MGQSLKNRLIIFGVSLAVALILLAPTIDREAVPKNWISKSLALGLDLSGGVQLVYEVETPEAVKSRLQGVINGVRATLRQEKVAVSRGKVNEQGQIELTLLSERGATRTKELILKEYGARLSLVREGDVGGDRYELVYAVSAAEAEAIERNAVTQAVETLRSRVDQFGVAEPLIHRMGEKRIMLQMPGVSDIASVKKIVGSVAKLEFRFLPRKQTTESLTLKDRSGTPVKVEEEVQMTGDLVDAASVGMTNGKVEVLLSFTAEGSKTFRRITADNVGANLAIILDNTVYSSPEIREAISGGRATISGGFSFEEAQQLAVVLRAGALPAPLNVMEERTVGPSLGKESIERGVQAILMGFVLVAVFMLFRYKKSGLVAIASLALNVVFLLAILSLFGATLTLPGLAGLALTIGMAVDSNVIIFERIREEISYGAGRDTAVTSGFDKALSAIIDSNMTTLVSALILYYFGSGPIRGFAVTLSVGILTTIYCATFVSRLAFDYFSLTTSDNKVSI